MTPSHRATSRTRSCATAPSGIPEALAQAMRAIPRAAMVVAGRRPPDPAGRASRARACSPPAILSRVAAPSGAGLPRHARTTARSSATLAAPEAAEPVPGRPGLRGRRTCARSPCAASCRRRSSACSPWRNRCSTGTGATASAPIAARRRTPPQAGFRRDCAACGTQHFPRTDPVVIMLIDARRQMPARPPGALSPRGCIPASQASSNRARPSRTRCGARPSRRPASGSARCATWPRSPGRFRHRS